MKRITLLSAGVLLFGLLVGCALVHQVIRATIPGLPDSPAPAYNTNDFAPWPPQ